MLNIIEMIESNPSLGTGNNRTGKTSYVMAETESEKFLCEQLITYIGSKRALLGFIGKGVDCVRGRLGKNKLDTFDVFSGSGVVARFLKAYSRRLVVNDIEKYSEVTNRCYLSNASELDLPHLVRVHNDVMARLANEPLCPGFIAEMYSPHDEHNIRPDERVFYTRRNAMYLDTARKLLSELPGLEERFFLGPLLSQASVHANTSGVFKGFYKNSTTKAGQFGGNNKDALVRILGHIGLPFPVLSRFECDVIVHRANANELASIVGDVDLAYIDPPYNQHPYGSNYFMLNLLVDYKRPENHSVVSGIPSDWNRSDYNKPKTAYAAFASLVESIRAKFLLISFNSEGFISKETMCDLLDTIGTTTVLETKYNTFRGSRNLAKRDMHVKEYLYLVEKR